MDQPITPGVLPHPSHIDAVAPVGSAVGFMTKLCVALVLPLTQIGTTTLVALHLLL